MIEERDGTYDDDEDILARSDPIALLGIDGQCGVEFLDGVRHRRDRDEQHLHEQHEHERLIATVQRRHASADARRNPTDASRIADRPNAEE